MTAAERRRRDRFGRLAETACAVRLRFSGYRILARRFRTPVGEIDIVARRGATVVFVEVKARRDRTATEVLSPRQRARIRRAAGAFLAAHPALAGCTMRFDLMLVAPWEWPRHVVDAWRG
ncbi:MAG: YraN family protein [Alphaproteobacteria bacterium]|nr:YraN family protein [Alphaproteobacteria bacterium]